jgi:hypothetical protein
MFAACELSTGKSGLRNRRIPQLGKAAYEIDEYLKEFSTARIPIRRQVILNEAIAHLVANVLPNLGIAEMARVQVQLALRDYIKSAV